MYMENTSKETISETRQVQAWKCVCNFEWPDRVKSLVNHTELIQPDCSTTYFKCEKKRINKSEISLIRWFSEGSAV